MPTVWANGRLVGVWSQRKGGSVVYGLFKPVDDEARALLDAGAGRLEGFLAGDVVTFQVSPRLKSPLEGLQPGVHLRGRELVRRVAGGRPAEGSSGVVSTAG